MRSLYDCGSWHNVVADYDTLETWSQFLSTLKVCWCEYVDVFVLAGKCAGIPIHHTYMGHQVYVQSYPWLQEAGTHFRSPLKPERNMRSQNILCTCSLITSSAPQQKYWSLNLIASSAYISPPNHHLSNTIVTQLYSAFHIQPPPPLYAQFSGPGSSSPPQSNASAALIPQLRGWTTILHILPPCLRGQPWVWKAAKLLQAMRPISKGYQLKYPIL